MDQQIDRGSVVVTGGATSAGLAIAKKFSELGRIVHICDVDRVALDQAQKVVGPGLAARVDVTDPRQVEGFFARVLGQGPIGVLINVVGLSGPRAPLQEVSPEDWNRTLAGSIGSSFLCARAVIPGFVARRDGVIINFSSSSTRTGLPNRTPYVVAKAGVEALTRNLARELGPFNIRVNAILPGAINNARLDKLIIEGAAERGMTPEDFERHLLRFISMRSRVEPEEIAEVAVFLASEAARHITGQLIGVDGNAEWEE